MSIDSLFELFLDLLLETFISIQFKIKFTNNQFGERVFKGQQTLENHLENDFSTFSTAKSIKRGKIISRVE